MIMSVLSSCKSGFVNSDYCELAKPIYFREAVVKQMQDDELKDWLKHNENFSEICGNINKL